jgi:hypothetical protein
MFLFFDFLLILVILVVAIVALSYFSLFVFGVIIDWNLKRGKNPEKWEKLREVMITNLKRGR